MDDRSIAALLTISENRSRILAVIVSMVGDFEAAEDLFQEAVLEILKSEQRYDPTRSFVPWACGVARNVVLEHWRRQAKMPSSGLSELIAELAMIVAEGEEDVWRRERVALRGCVQRLPDRMQKLLLLRYGHNLKGQALAESAAVRVGSLRTTLARLRSKLRECIESKVAHAIPEATA
ncbi:sigma-70 family RNA polymerase sigma factor [Pirellulimonas nuda]|nr:sigma-70 family RNA polymerase sigma factor [Pirellulimonas nuda]